MPLIKLKSAARHWHFTVKRGAILLWGWKQNRGRSALGSEHQHPGAGLRWPENTASQCRALQAPSRLLPRHGKMQLVSRPVCDFHQKWLNSHRSRSSRTPPAKHSLAKRCFILTRRSNPRRTSLPHPQTQRGETVCVSRHCSASFGERGNLSARLEAPSPAA